jgi:tetratricopeptide (TPR) repeat protein
VKPVARIVAHAAHAQEPNLFTTAPVPAVRKVLEKAGWSSDDVDLWEVNEAFACVAMIAMRDLGIPREKLNVHGGATALGHPIGASGARILATLLSALEDPRRQARRRHPVHRRRRSHGDGGGAGRGRTPARTGPGRACAGSRPAKPSSTRRRSTRMRRASSPDAAGGAMIEWRPAPAENLAAPRQALALLEHALAADPANPRLRLKLADLHLDRFDFAAAAKVLEPAPGDERVASRLARSYNALGRIAEAIEAIAAESRPQHERAVALLGLGREAEAEAELRALLAEEPGHRHACWRLARLLRKAGRDSELLDMCEGLAACGVRHAQLFSDWGAALALAGRTVEARALLFDPARITEMALPVPEGFDDLDAFNSVLAEEILTSPDAVSDFPPEEANRGSTRVHAFFASRRPELVRALTERLRPLIDAWAPSPAAGPDPWRESRPRRAHLKVWGLIQRGGEHEAWHIHRGGWASGVYYVRIPRAVAEAKDGRGAIEYGPPPSLAEALPGLVPPRRFKPREGRLLLAPSHYAHRTIPPMTDEPRVSFAFDIVPCD